MEDSAILDLYEKRDETAIALSQEKYGKYCFTVAMNVLSDAGKAEECISDTWLAAWNQIPPARPTSLGAYLSRIARNISLDRLEADSAKKRGSGIVPLALEELDGCIPSGENPEAALEKEELTEIINRFLHSLPKKESQIFLARYFWFSSATEIARRTGLPATSVRVMLLRTRKKLKEYLERSGFPE